jgi:wyosine [tRNA(Phe)-imidazoG37] synthetase (radical SAM superfamily)
MPKYLFGPVFSRRIGVSLGVDLVPSKTCSMDCVYCEAGATTSLSSKRCEFYDTAEIIGELDGFLSKNPEIDYVTFSGAGEPTLHSGMGRIVKFLKGKYPQYRICLITNGILLGSDQMIDELAGIDLVIPSLDAADDETLGRINRPATGISSRDIVKSLEKFRSRSKALFWLEIFVVPGINDSQESIEAIRKAVVRINPDKVQLNSLDRPGTEKWVRKASESEILPFVRALEPHVTVEVIGKPALSASAIAREKLSVGDLEEAVTEIVRRRPCTLPEIASALSVGDDKLLPVLGKMADTGVIKVEKMPRGVFYRV